LRFAYAEFNPDSAFVAVFRHFLRKWILVSSAGSQRSSAVSIVLLGVVLILQSPLTDFLSQLAYFKSILGEV
jgi:hypothetical protein